MESTSYNFTTMHDKIMMNHMINSESSEDLYYLYPDSENNKDDINDFNDQHGGDRFDKSNLNTGSNPLDKHKRNIIKNGNQSVLNKNNVGEPNGGFPPIYIIELGDDDSSTKNRLLTTRKSAVSIRDILKNKK